MPKPLNPKDIYELLENDEGEIMLLLYAGETEPQTAAFHINEKLKNLELYRNAKDLVIIDGLAAESIVKLKKINTLYVCEMKYNDTSDGENEILYAYPATPKEVNVPTNEKKEPSLSEKAKTAREKVLKKETQPQK